MRNQFIELGNTTFCIDAVSHAYREEATVHVESCMFASRCLSLRFFTTDEAKKAYRKLSNALIGKAKKAKK
jgi:uncharacterized protein YigE (DUF2233 family)